MKFNSITDLKAAGFEGFISVADLRNKAIDNIVPRKRGVYMFLWEFDNKPDFLIKGTGGYFKGKNPDVSVDVLRDKWVNNTCVLYIGETGSGKSNTNRVLSIRIDEALRFGAGEDVAHYGGRYLWQIKNSGSLIVCWKPVVSVSPKEEKEKLLLLFKSIYHKTPFANIKG